MRLRHLIISLVVWVLFLGTTYSITTIRIDRAENRIRESGTDAIQELSKLVSLPLLGSDTETIHSMLVYAAKKADLVHASVVDHQNEMVAFTGTEKVTPARNPEMYSGDQVSFWEGELPDHKRIFSFASDIFYAGTKIGRMHIAQAAEEPLRLRNQFLIVAVLSCVILLFLIITFRYYPGIWASLPRLKKVYRLDYPSDVALESSLVRCPLCGVEKPFSRGLFKRTNFNRLLIIKASLNKSGASSDTDLKGMRLSDLAKRDDFLWFKRLIVLRCAEIIKKLAA
jgi:hypothetical protein